MPDVFLSRQPLVNRQSKIIANRLSLHACRGASTADAVAALESLTEFWPQGEKLVFVNAVNLPFDATLAAWHAPASATLEVPASALSGPDAADVAAALQSAATPLCLGYDAQAAAALSAGVPLRFIGFDARTYAPPLLRVLAAQTQPHGIGVAFNVDGAQNFQDCLDAGLIAAASWFFKTQNKAPAKSLNAGQTQIIRVINLVRKNADIKEIETALKQDVALSYKLLRYINSAGFGLSCEIQSFRHAVTILGYDKLNKWLSLLLATASKDPMAPALMHTSLTRARLMETLAHGLVSPQEYDNLFITGAFSLLDALLGVSMDKVLETMSLPEAITDALLGHGGLYGPFLELAKASEETDGAAIADQAGMLGLSADQFNRAQIQALAFAETMEL